MFNRGTRRRRALVVAVTVAAAMVVTSTVVSPTAAAAPAVAPPELGAPPVASDEGTETAPAAAGERGSGFSPSTLAAALQLYRDQYLPSADGQVGWTGSIAGCTPGSTTLAFRNGVLRRINYFRAMAGVPDDMALNGDFNARAQRVALMMAANQQLNHAPPSTWRCATAAGRADANKSNLSMGHFGTSAIDTYMLDPGAGNTAAGHRRWVLHPPTRNMGVGAIPGSTPQTRINALFVMDGRIFDPVPRPRDGFVAWPPSGFVPQTVMYNRWSFGIDGANFSNATVTLTRNGTSVNATRYAPVANFGINTLVWDIPNTLAGRKGEWRVRINGVRLNGATRSFDYTVNVFDPDEPVDPVTITTPANEARYARGSSVAARYSCFMANLVSCVGTVANGAPIDTSTLGAKSFTVTGTDAAGAQQSQTHRYIVEDLTNPTVTVTAPPEGAVYLQGQAVTADYSCADEGGGSGLASCTAPVADGAAIDTAVLGKRPFTVTATDNAGNTRSVDRAFKVSTRPDMAIGNDPAGPFIGDGTYGTVPSFSQTQPATVTRGGTATFFATVGNDANAPATFRLDGTPTNATGYRVRYLLGATDITTAVDAGTYRVPNLAAGATVTITIQVKATTSAARGSIVKVKLAAHSVAGPPAMDIARAKVTTN